MQYVQEYEKDSRLCLLYDSETGEEVWLRRHGLHLRNREYMEYILSLERRGSANPMTQQEIERFFLGDDYRHVTFGNVDIFTGSAKSSGTGGKGICYHPTDDIADNFFKWDFEAPSVGHVLWSESNDELTVRSIAVDSNFHFRQLMYEALLDELKLFALKSLGYQYAEKISAVLRDESEQPFWEKHGFRLVRMPEGVQMMCWQPEFEGVQKENRWYEKEKGKEKKSS